MGRRFQFSLQRVFAATTTVAVAIALLIYDVEQVGNRRFWWFLAQLLGFSILIGLAIGFIVSRTWKGIAIAVIVCGCLGGAFDTFVYWLVSELSHQ
jgi:hypothetical protein